MLVAGALLGLAVLAKGLVPLVLFIPALWFLRHRIRDLALLFLAAIVIAAPWYVLVTLRNGTPFLEEFFWKHHFGRFLSSALQHGQPFGFTCRCCWPGSFRGRRSSHSCSTRRFFEIAARSFLLAWFAWGFLFFSISRNKLPGYLLPLLASRLPR